MHLRVTDGVKLPTDRQINISVGGTSINPCQGYLAFSKNVDMVQMTHTVCEHCCDRSVNGFQRKVAKVLPGKVATLR